MKDGVTIKRDKNGVSHISGQTEEDLYWGLGYTHAKDRGLQMLLTRIIGQGRICEYLDAGDDIGHWPPIAISCFSIKGYEDP